MQWVVWETRRRCAELDMTARQTREASNLAVELCETASAYRMDDVTSSISAAIDGILARDRRH